MNSAIRQRRSSKLGAADVEDGGMAWVLQALRVAEREHHHHVLGSIDSDPGEAVHTPRLTRVHSRLLMLCALITIRSTASCRSTSRSVLSGAVRNVLIVALSSSIGS